MADMRPPVAVLIAAHIKAQPRKTAVLGILFVLMLGVYARMYVRSYGPRNASAEQSAATTGISEPAQRTRPPAGRVTLELPLRRELRRDPFRVNLSDYPVHHPEDVSGHQPVTGTPGDEEIRSKAERLRLQSILWREGGSAVACIGERMVQAGDEIEGLTVTRVEATRVYLEREGVRFVLKLR